MSFVVACFVVVAASTFKRKSFDFLRELITEGHENEPIIAMFGRTSGSFGCRLHYIVSRWWSLWHHYGMAAHSKANAAAATTTLPGRTSSINFLENGNTNVVGEYDVYCCYYYYCYFTFIGTFCALWKENVSKCSARVRVTCLSCVTKLNDVPVPECRRSQEISSKRRQGYEFDMKFVSHSGNLTHFPKEQRKRKSETKKTKLTSPEYQELWIWTMCDAAFISCSAIKYAWSASGFCCCRNSMEVLCIRSVLGSGHVPEFHISPRFDNNIMRSLLRNSAKSKC